MSQDSLQKTSLFEDNVSSEGTPKEKKVYYLKSKEVITKSLDLSDYDVLVVQGEVTIKCPCPIIAPTDLAIKGKPGSKLTLINTEECQPCIGGKAHTGMSFGRWSPCYIYKPERLVIHGIDVICESVVDDFTIGSYNHDKTTEIVCYYGSIECPEIHGERHLIEKAEAPQGSTKISMYPTYVIVEPGKEFVKPFTDSQQRVLCEMELNRIDTSRMHTDIKPADMRKFLKYAKLGMDVNPAYDNYEFIKGHVGIYLGALYVGVDKNDSEFKKYMLLMNTYGMAAEWAIDSMKRAIVCDKICKAEGLPPVNEDDQKTFLRSYVQERILLKSLNPQELQTWWELIPSELYCNYGSTLLDTQGYYGQLE